MTSIILKGKMNKVYPQFMRSNSKYTLMLCWIRKFYVVKETA